MGKAKIPRRQPGSLAPQPWEAPPSAFRPCLHHLPGLGGRGHLGGMSLGAQ